MTTAGKIGLGVLAVAAIAGGIVGEKRWSQRNLVTVQTSLVAREDLNAVVTASGEIKPKNYINLGANAMGPLTEIYVKEGDRVKKNQVVARIENTQADADVAAQKATIASAEADSAAAEAGIKAQDDAITTQQATLDRYKNRAPARQGLPGPLRADVQREAGGQAGLRSEAGGLRVGVGQRQRKRGSAGGSRNRSARRAWRS